jgi:hypothetical protein
MLELLAGMGGLWRIFVGLVERARRAPGCLTGFPFFISSLFIRHLRRLVAFRLKHSQRAIMSTMSRKCQGVQVAFQLLLEEGATDTTP